MTEASHRVPEPPADGGRMPPRWVMIVIGLLAAHTILTLVMVRIAVHNNSGVIPNYYQRAVNWDKLQAEKQASAKLGWQVQVEPSTAVDVSGGRQVSFYLLDAQQKPIPQATLDVVYFHVGHPDEFKQVTLNPVEPGKFTGRLISPHAGKWELRLTATAGTTKFTDTRESYFSNAGQ